MPKGIFDRQTFKKPPRSKSGMKGVIYQPTTVNSNGERVPLKRPWKAYIRQHGMYVTLGYFSTKESAARVYNEAAVKLYGPEAYLNPLQRSE